MEAMLAGSAARPRIPAAAAPPLPTTSKCGRRSVPLPPAPTTTTVCTRPPPLQIGGSIPAQSRVGCTGRPRGALSSPSAALSGGQMLVYVPPHPLVKHWVAILRNELTPSPMFRSAMAELGRILIYEASRDWLLTISGEVQTPCGIASIEFIDPREPVKVVPILRAGLVLVEQIATVLPATQTYHLGYVRDEETLQPTSYLNKLPETFPANSRVLVSDPMLATGGTIVAALEELTKRGVDHKLIRVVAAVAAPPALQKLSERFPGLRVYVGTIDEVLNDKGYIVPGFGDAGDRCFAT